MVIAARCRVSVMLTLVIMFGIGYATDLPETYDDARMTAEDIANLLPYVANEEYIRHIHSIINSYKNDLQGGQMVIETNAMIDTKYKTWKRNADLINSLLALPKGMNDAGR